MKSVNLMNETKNLGYDRLETTAVGSLVKAVIVEEEEIYYNVLTSNSIPTILPKKST